MTAYGDKKHIVYINPYGQASRIKLRSNQDVLPGSTIRVSNKSLTDQSERTESYQQLSSIVTSVISIAILASTYSN